ncbi:MAG: ATP-dependent Clp protease ATP-binding subunit [Clostridiaceae bacterium]|nr:ATP-dependent Clp protease ATP-binding subunit [Clostridiaceae bacterium]
MAKCSMCKINEAVIFTSRFNGSERIDEGLCLKCAWETNIGGMEEVFARAGVNDSNIDELTERMNQVIGQMSGHNTEDLFRMLLGNEEFPSGFGLSADSDDFDDGIDDDEDEDDDEEAGSTGLMTANIGGDSNDLMQVRRSTREKRRAKKKDKKRKFLDQFGTNLTDKARNGELDRLIGRDEELNRVIQILNRRQKNNPALIGEPGVGKSAVAEGLAVRIADGTVPVKLLDQEVYLLDMTAMVAGTQFRGQFESRMKGVVDDAKNSGNIILVIDELHNIMGAGDAEGAMNAANILKPALGRGDIRVIGTTTLDEYRRFIEKDSALERRFQKVIIDEPTLEETLQILRGIKGYYEQHHQVYFPECVLETAVRLSDRYITDRFLPDKAIDLLDEAGSEVNLKNSKLVEICEKQDQYEDLQAVREELENKLSEAGAGDDKVRETLYEEQAENKSQLLRLENELAELKQEAQPTEVTEKDIAKVVEMWTGIPVTKITETESERLLGLEDELHKTVIGQVEAISAVARAIRRKRSGLVNRDKPASFIFVGPTGVGKTELAKAVAEAMFDSREAIVRLDMSEYMEPHTVSKLIGSPPGYVGYDDGGQLTERIRRKPYSVILLDEIEKAHADVFNILLQILDEGRLTDSHGRVVNFSNTLIIMTSNAGTSFKRHSIGFGNQDHEALESRVQSVMRDLFRPEFLNRVDEIVVFHELTPEELRQIVDLMIAEIQTDLEVRGLKLIVTDKARDELAKSGYDEKFGARPLRRLITRTIEDKLADLMLSGDLDGVAGVSCDYVKTGDKGEFTFAWI